MILFTQEISINLSFNIKYHLGTADMKMNLIYLK